MISLNFKQQINALIKIYSFNLDTPRNHSLERRRRIFFSALTAISAKMLSILTLIISLPLTLKYLGTERFGIWMTINSVIALLKFADLGIGNGVLNVVAEAYGQDDYKAIQKYVSSGFIILTSIAVIILILFVILYPLISWIHLFNVQSELAMQEIEPAVIAFTICFALSIPLNIVQRVQIGLQSSFIANLWQGFGSLLGLVGTLIVIFFQAGLPWLILAVVGTPLLASLLNGMVFFGYIRPELRPKLILASSHTMKKIANFGLLFLVLQIVVALAYTSDNFIIAQLLGVDVVTQYAVSEKMFGISIMLLGIGLAPLWPAYSEAIARGDIPWVKRTLRKSITISLYFSIGISLLLVLFGKEILLLWIGYKVNPPFSLLLGLGIWKIIETMGNALAFFLNGANIVRLQIIIATLTAIGAITLKIILVPVIGIAGVVWATIISYLIFSIIPLYFFIPKILISISDK